MDVKKEKEKLSVYAICNTEIATYSVNYDKEDGVLSNLQVEVLMKNTIDGQEILNSVGTISYKDKVLSTHLWDINNTPVIIGEFNQILEVINS